MNRRMALLIGCSLVASAAVAQRGRGPAPDPLVRENATVKLAAHSYVIPDGGVGVVPNVGIVVGDRAALVVDPGLGRRNGETVLKEVARLGAPAQLYVASTHFHPEHTTGYAAFPPGAKYVNSTVQEAEFAQSGEQMVQRFASFTPVMAELLKGFERRVADITFDREYVLNLGGVSVRMLVVGPTHTRGDTGFFVEGDGVLFAGDVVMNRQFVAANPASSIKAWLAALDAFERMGPHTIVPAHGEVGDGSLIPAQRAVLRAVQTRAGELKAEGRSAEETAQIVQMELQTGYPAWTRPNAVAAAARAAYAEAP
jgi:glyoxylase-like metal-dependent hydrolase (beta-lactamase superfamily II)